MITIQIKILPTIEQELILRTSSFEYINRVNEIVRLIMESNPYLSMFIIRNVSRLKKESIGSLQLMTQEIKWRNYIQLFYKFLDVVYQ